MGTDGSAPLEDAGPGDECTDRTDCPGTDLACSARSCTNGRCSILSSPPGTPCDYSGGTVCDGAGACVECASGGDCPEGICQRNRCVPAGCNDGVANGSETDVDCGGPCGPCDLGEMCGAPADCVSGVCTSGRCATCQRDGDCASGSYCNNLAQCVPKRAAGEMCTAAGQCLSGFCPARDGVCCDRACDGACEACSRPRTDVTSGTCGPIRFGTDPDMECTATDPSRCGANGTGCNGSTTSPGCNLYPAGSTCGAGSCLGGEIFGGSMCDGNGTCARGNPMSCAPYTCNSGGTACLATCTSDADCTTGNECDSTDHCSPLCPAGQVKCGATCIDPLTDEMYCGALTGCTGYDTCVSPETCTAGACVTAPAIDPQCMRPYNMLGTTERRGGAGATICDRAGAAEVSSDWRGAGWYRFSGAAGTELRTTAPGPSYDLCRTSAKGWLNGTRPATTDGIVSRQVCFDFTGTPCWQMTNIRMVNCGTFYLYELPDVAFCYLAYCGM